MRRRPLRTARSAPATLLGAALLALLGACADGTSEHSVILITLDTVRADHLSRTGYERHTTPRLDAFTARGAWFPWAFSTCSYTVPAHASMLTGLYPSFHSVSLMNGQFGLLPQETTLPELLAERGVRTAAIVSNVVLRAGIGLSQGFETYDDKLPDVELVRRVPERRADKAVDRALARLDELEGERFFLWLHLQDPHGPYTPPTEVQRPAPVEGEAVPEADTTRLPVGQDHSGHGALPAYQVVGDEREVEAYHARYEREIRAMDRELGRLFEQLEQRGLLETTLVVLTADHGEALGEDGYWFSHSHSTGLDQVHVPLAFVGGGVEPGLEVDQPVSNLSVFATILEYMDVPMPPESQSKSLLATVREGAPAPQGPIFTESLSQRGVVLDGVYLRTDRRPASDEEFWSESPLSQGFFKPLGTEALRLTKEGPVAVETPAELAQELRSFSADADFAIHRIYQGVEMTEMGDELLDQLRALGYAK